MTEKRYYAHKHLLQENQVHDKICHNFMNIDETVKHMNNEYWKYKQLKKENEQLSLIEDEIDKKIAVLTDAKIKSLQNEDEELLGKIKFSIQVLRELKEVIVE